jgi:tetratricopeptide (TPR) repeat protein
MSKFHPPRCAPLLILTYLLLPLALSCSGGKGTDAASGTSHDKVIPVDAEKTRLNQAIDEATDAIRRDPNGVDERGELAYARRGRAHAEKGEHDKAIADFTEAIRLYPSVKGPYLQARLTESSSGRAECYFKKGEYDKAIADYTEVLKSTPFGGPTVSDALTFGAVRATAHYKRGVCYDEKGDHAKAMEDYKEAARVDPSFANNEDLKKRMGK